MIPMNLSDFAIPNIYGLDYHCIIRGISKCEAINLMQKINLIEKSRTSKNINIYYHIQKWVNKL